tara:strand:+ start:221 stop:637 length:417 start_codon:yes stop_codon:yes gene_type:complete
VHEFGRIIRVLGDRSSVRLEHLVVVQDVGGSNPLGHPNKIELMKNLLNDAELKDAQNLLPDWEVSGEFLFRVFLFKNFVEAFDFMTAISSTAEEMNHHPDWANVYNKVEVRLSTHDSGGVTSLDVQLASIMDSLFTED